MPADDTRACLSRSLGNAPLLERCSFLRPMFRSRPRPLPRQPLAVLLLRVAIHQFIHSVAVSLSTSLSR